MRKKGQNSIRIGSNNVKVKEGASKYFSFKYATWGKFARAEIKILFDAKICKLLLKIVNQLRQKYALVDA